MNFLEKLLSNRGMLPFQFKWSTGYVVREKRDVSELKALRNEEFEYFGGRKEILWNGLVSSDDDFDMLCVIQYVFTVSSSVLMEVKRVYKRRKWKRGFYPNTFVKLEERKLGNSGRKVGSKNLVKEYDDEKESLEDVLSRCDHNMNVAVIKGFYLWFEDAYREKCKTLNKDFDINKCKEQWKNLRGEDKADL